MKKLLTFATLAAVTVSFSALMPGVAKAASPILAPNSLPVISDGSAPSVDRQTMNQLMARAAQENKSIILEFRAAWCPPCTQFAMDINAHPADLQELAASGYILASAEFEAIDQGGGNLNLLDFNDFMPAFVPFFPSFYLYSPKTGAWQGIGTFSAYADLKAALASPANLVPYTVATLQAAINAADQTQAFNTPQANVSFMGNFAGIYSYDDAKAITALLKSQDSAHPKLGLLGLEQQIEASYLWYYPAIGAVSLADFTKDFPDVAATIVDVSNDNFQAIPFYDQVSYVWRTQGLKQAVSQCASIWQKYRGELIPGKLATADFQKQLASMDSDAQIACADLELRSTGVTAALQAEYAKINKANDADWFLIAGMGDPTTAISLYHTHYESFVTQYNMDLTSTQSDLQSAQASNNASQIASDQQEIAIDNTMLTYHAQVDSNVEGALKAGKPVSVLDVEN